MSDLIRPNIIASYHADAERAWAKRRAMIAARDDQYRALNLEFGRVNEDGSPTSSYMGAAGPQYHARYRAIDNAFRPHYERISSQQEAWRKGLGPTLSEFLFLDNFFEPLLKQLCQTPRFGESYRSDLIRRKAVIYVDDWKKKECVGGIYARIGAEIDLFPYAAKRCRAFFGIAALNLGASLAMRRFRHEWKRALYEAISRQRLTDK